MGVLNWLREGKAVTFFLLLLLLLCQQGKQPELCNSSIIKPRNVIHCLSLRCKYQFPTHNMSCILCLPFIKIITHANDVHYMDRVTEIVCMSNYHY